MPETQVDSPLDGGASPELGHILDRIVRTKREEIATLAQRSEEIRAMVGDVPEARDFRAALRAPDRVGLIAEVKRRSPGAGPIRTGLNPAALARGYGESGAVAISVLTDEHYFGGSLRDLGAVREAVRVPVLRKDFTLVEDQVWEARAAGADAILLIVRILEDAPLRDLRLLAAELGMAALVEAHDRSELERALESGAEIVGINNRDLATFTTRIENTLDLIGLLPDSVILVSESGIHTRGDVERLGDAGVDAILVGEALLRARNPAAKAAELAALRRRSRTNSSPRVPGGPDEG